MIENVFTKNEKEVTKSSIMKNKKIRKILIVQLCILEVFLFTLLFDEKEKSCIVEKENNDLLVYNYSSMLLSPKIEKVEIDLETEEKYENEDKNEESSVIEIDFEKIAKEVLEEIIVEEEVVNNPVPVANYYVQPVSYVAPISDVNYSVAQNLVEYAKQFVGYPYVYGGNSLTNGTDCSGFTKLIYAQYGINLPRVAYDQAFVGVEVPISQIQIGDLVLSGYDGKTHHVAIYIGNNQLVHALNSNVGIVITDLYIMPITHVRRVL